MRNHFPAHAFSPHTSIALGGFPPNNRSREARVSRQDGVSMRNTFQVFLGMALGLAVSIGSAQAQFKNGSQATEINLPRTSQHAVITQTIGISTVTINYS